jgi:hypothetical protein
VNNVCGLFTHRFDDVAEDVVNLLAGHRLGSRDGLFDISTDSINISLENSLL